MGSPTRVITREQRARITVRLVAAAAIATSTFTVLSPHGAPVSALADVTISQSTPATTLIGQTTGVTATIGNAGTTTAFNLAMVLTLPVGVHLASSEIPPSDVIDLLDVDGLPAGTAYGWENIVDIVPGGVYNFDYSFSHDVGTGPDLWELFEVIQAPMSAYVSDDEATEPAVNALMTGSQRQASVTLAASDATAPGQTELVPILLTKSEPSAEGELLRGVHDHQTVYTISAQTGAAPGVTIGLVDDYIPAGVEFLGCGTDDNSLTEEYQGSGPLNPGNAPAMTNPCLDPVLVDTVLNPPGLPGGVYTHVQWDISQALPINSTVSISYIAGIPLRENTTTWPNGTPDPASGEQGSNLDNNTGPLTTQNGDGFGYTNHVTAATTLDGASGDVTAETTVQAVDLSVHKFVDNSVINQLEISTWTLLLETSEYVVADGVANLELVDVTPNGTCPIGSAHPGCVALTEPAATPAYSATVYEAAGPGTTTLTWDDFDALEIGPNQSGYIVFSTQALPSYDTGDPVSTNDEWTNTVDLTADVTTFADEGPDGTHDPARPVTDDSAASQAGTPVAFTKEVARPPDGVTCGNGAGLDWQLDLVVATGPGDRVCFRLTATPPPALDTIEATLSDFLPIGFRYEDGSSTPGPANQVPTEIVEAPAVFGVPETGQRIDWTLVPSTFIEPAQVAQVVFGAILDGGDDFLMPDLAESGDALVNDARYSYENTSGEIFVDADSASVVYEEALLDLTKGITSVDATPYPFVDTVTDVNGTQTVTYEIVINNTGDADAIGVDVLDTLPINDDDNLSSANAVCVPDIDPDEISHGGTCAGNDITWNDLTVPAGGSLTLSYEWLLPAGVPASTGWTNEAGILEYRSTTNAGPDFVYVPHDNIDPGREGNTQPARDDAHVFSPGISVIKTRDTSITETGNAQSNQATIGEVVHYRIEYRQSQSTTVDDPELVDDLAGSGLDVDESSVVVDTFQPLPGAPCDSGGAGGPLVTTAVDDVITISRTGPVTAPVGLDACAVITFDATVVDIAATVRPDVLRNDVTVTFFVSGVERVVSTGVDTQVVEPNLVIDKRSAVTGTVLPGTQVPYSIVVTNANATQVSPAHDLVVVDTLPADVVDVTDIVPAGAAYTPGGSTITWTLPPGSDLLPGASMTLSYTATLASPLDAGATITNTATVTGTSIAGAVGGERTSGSACSIAETCPGYFADDTLTLTVGGPTIVKSVDPATYTFGDVVTYSIDATFPANLNFGATTVTDDLAGGALLFLDTVSAVCVGCSDTDRAGYDPPTNGLSDDPPVWDFGTLGPSASTRRVFINYRAVVIDNSLLAAGDTLTNTANLVYAAGDPDPSSSAVITLAEPELTLTKSVASTTEPTLRSDTSTTSAVAALPGDTLSYQLAITNTGDWTAYDIVVIDEPDTESSNGDCTGTARLTAPSVTLNPLWTVVDPSLADDPCLEWLVPSILPGQTITLTYSAVVPPTFADLILGPEFVNVAEIPEYFALTAGERAVAPDEVRLYPDPETPLVDEGYVNINGSVLGDFVWLDLNADGVQDPGEPGIPDVPVQVVGPSGTIPLVTDADGIYLTYDGVTIPPTWLEAGTYTVTVDTAAPNLAGLANTFDPDGGSNSTASVALGENVEDLDQDFGYAGSGVIGDTVWLDFDADGVEDAGEPGIPGVTVDLLWAGFNGTFGDGDDVDFDDQTTDAAGGYLYTNLPPGNYQVTVDETTLPFPLDETFELDGSLDANTTVALAGAATNLDVDFGYAGDAAVGDLVWLDRNGNGVLDPVTEPGIPGIVVTATWGGFDGAIGGGDDIVLPTVTTGPVVGTGNYLFEHLPPGEVEVVVSDAGLLAAGLTRTFDPEGDLDATSLRDLTVGEVDLAADFGYQGANTVGDLVWLDLDGDGNGPDSTVGADPAEPGIAGQSVVVTWAGVNGTFGDADDLNYLPVLTDADGRWTVAGLPNGLVRAQLVAGPTTNLVPTFDRDGGLDRVAVFSITGTDLDFDFGFTGNGTIGDRVWLDFDADGAQDAGEPGIPGVDVTLTWAGADGTFDVAPGGDDVDYPIDTTDADGIYGFSLLPPGNYRVAVDEGTIPVDLLQTFDIDGAGDSSADLALAPAGNRTDVDFGYAGEASLGDQLWLDRNGNGTFEPALEPGIPGVTVTLTWSAWDQILGTADDIEFPIDVTDASGVYGFQNLPPGQVEVVVSDAPLLAAGLVRTVDPQGALDGIAVRTLTVGQLDLAVDFAYEGANTVGDLVWLDLDGDGVGPDSGAPDTTEPGIPGQTVLVTWAGINGTFDDADDLVYLPVQTDADGAWTVDGLPNGPVRAQLVGGPTADLLATFDRDGALDRVTIATIAGDDLEFDFGFTGTAVLGDLVWLDFDADGVQDPIEPGIPNITTTVRWAGFDGAFTILAGDDVTYPSEDTSAIPPFRGMYSYDLLPPGLYEVTVDESDLAPGLVPTFDLTPPADSVARRTLTVGQTGNNVDFGYAGEAVLGDFVWWDLDGDGIQDPGEPGIPDVTVRMTWSAYDGDLGTLDDIAWPAAVTDADGRYTFPNLPAGQFEVTLDTTTLPAGLTQTFDLDGGGDAVASRPLAIGATGNNVDFGFTGELSIGDLVWRDVNLDGDRQSSEPALPGAGITITFLGADDAVGGSDDVTFAMTTGDPPLLDPTQRLVQAGAPLPGEPFYEATGLVPGTYVVELDPATLPGQTPSSDLDGGDPTVTEVTLVDASEPDADFAVFRNIAPVVVPPTTQAVCGGDVLVDPIAGVTDGNGDPLALVPGSIVAPPGVTVTVQPNGQLRIVVSSSVTNDFQVRWAVADDHGGQVSVVLSVDISCVTATAAVVCAANGAQYLSYTVTGSPAPATPPVTITWIDVAGTVRATTGGQPVTGEILWPGYEVSPGGALVARPTQSGPFGWALGTVTVTFTSANGAVSQPLTPGSPCRVLPATGSDAAPWLPFAGGLVLAGGLLLAASRRRRSISPG